MNALRLLSVPLALGLAAATASCRSGDAPPPAPTPDAPSPAAADTAAAGFGAWSSLDREQREQFMKAVVMPRMKAAFDTWEPGEGAEMKCRSCHGPGAQDKTFRMPNPALPKLPTSPEGWAAMEREEPDAVKFMKEQVVPTMAGLLGVAPYDPKTGKGFGCFSCHTAK